MILLKKEWMNAVQLRNVLLLGPNASALWPYPNFYAAGLETLGDFARHGDVFFAAPLIDTL